MELRTVGEIALTLGFIIFGGMLLTAEKAYKCDANGLAMECDKLTQYYGLENGKCWNSEYGNKLCKSGWDPLMGVAEYKSPDDTISVKVTANGKDWLCDLENNEVTSYTKCNSNKGTEGYLGELI